MNFYSSFETHVFMDHLFRKFALTFSRKADDFIHCIIQPIFTQHLLYPYTLLANMEMVVNKTLKKKSVSHGAYILVGVVNNNQNNKNKLVKYIEWKIVINAMEKIKQEKV